jgi:hypothetical protein
MIHLNNQIKGPVWDYGFNKCTFKNYVFEIATFLKSQRHLIKHLLFFFIKYLPYKIMILVYIRVFPNKHPLTCL